ncbi:MAG: DNA-deoxyinosine glycosylase [Fusicatenibacter sp.]|nr:DNA-deoxyinosine glycosylase [Fusicatenibacter sp.]
MSQSKKTEASCVVHPISPVFDENSRILILGSFPSVKSRESGFFYGHPQNRFWKVLSHLTEEKLPVTIEEKKEFLLRNRIALWDVIASCTIIGSSDSSIRDVVPNDLSVILAGARISQIFCNGNTSYQLYVKYLQKETNRTAVRLPSTSPANAAWQMERLCNSWKECLSFCRE